METILIVEDDPHVQKSLMRLFQSDGYRVEVCGDGLSAMNAFRKGSPIAVILDLMLPILSGKDVCREIRKESPYPAIIVVSGLTDEFDKILLLELGADDYVTKPFSSIELLARVKAAIRRVQESANPSDQIRFGEASVNFIKMRASVSGSPVCLTTSEFRMLKFLAQNMDRVVRRSEILTEVFGDEACCESRIVDNVILKLRQKLERDPANPVHIVTVRGLGYRFAF
ncbi:MAG TPA: response regulator transcription factor [Terracidiphilus sp.]|jgi:DNA-binding response OmpR family regulator